MNNQDNLEIMKRLETLAYKESRPFCMTCYKTALSGRCKSCHSDDLARERVGSGVEFGVTWIIEELVQENCTPVDLSDAFEDSVRDCYPETTKCGWLDLDTATVIQEMDPVSWRIALGEYEDSEISEGLIMTFGSKLYSVHDIEQYLDTELGSDDSIK